MGKETAPRPEFCAAEFCAKVCAEVCAAGVFVVEEFAAGVFVAEECTAEVRVFKVMGARMFCAGRWVIGTRQVGDGVVGAESAQCEVRFERSVVCLKAEVDGHRINSLF